MADRAEHSGRIVGGWEAWSAAVLMVVSAACSGSSPPETAPDPAVAEVPDQSQAASGQPAGQPTMAAEPAGVAGNEPSGATADEDAGEISGHGDSRLPNY